jgi:hypothetical protein
MLRTHPVRVLVAVAVLAVALLLLSAPGADATSGAWYYISAFGWFGFVLTTLVFLVLAVMAIVNRLRHRTTA